MGEQGEPYRMSVSTAERRRSRRMAASHPAALYGDNGSLVARGRTSNISENGLFLLAKIRGKTPQEGGQVVLEMSVPDASSKPNRRRCTRTVRFIARIVRSVRLGHLVGLGVEFQQQLV